MPAIRRSQDGQVFVHQDEKAIPVSVRPCFPWSNPRHFVSLRDRKNEEILLVERIEDLDAESAEALTRALAEAEFSLEVTRIRSIERHFELRIWKVDTTHGPRTFEIRIDDWPRVLPDGGLAITDLAGDLYTIKDKSRLDERSRRLLFAYAD